MLFRSITIEDEQLCRIMGQHLDVMSYNYYTFGFYPSTGVTFAGYNRWTGSGSTSPLAPLSGTVAGLTGGLTGGTPTSVLEVITAVEKVTGTTYGWVELRKWCKANGVEAENVPDPLYGDVKAWPSSAWMAVHGVSLLALFAK